MATLLPFSISIILPCRNEEQNIPELYRRLKAVLDNESVRYELVFVDDHSTDTTFELLHALHSRDPGVKAIRLSRQFGHQVALTAGLEWVSSDVVILMDADLQHPPELIPDMLRYWKQGCDIVYAVREKTVGQASYENWLVGFFYKFFNFLSDTQIPANAADFKLLSRRVVETLRHMPERSRFLRGLTHWVGFTSTAVGFVCPPRKQGKSKYTFSGRVLLALDGFFAFSVVPLRIAFFLGLIVLLSSIAFSVYVFMEWYFSGTVRGWASIIIPMMILHGSELLIIGILGEYIGRIYHETKQRPLYVVEEVEGFTKPPEKLTLGQHHSE